MQNHFRPLSKSGILLSAIIEANLHIIMNDPLRDNRIFPEEMQQKSLPSKKNPNLSWLWIVVGILLLALLAWYGYQAYKNNTADTDMPTLKEQQDIFNAVRSDQPVTEEQQNEQIQFFFNGEQSVN